jgi:histidine ammonia-lyase
MPESVLTLSLDTPVELADIVAVARGGRTVALADATRQALAERRDQVERFVRESGTPHYGFNRGFGHNQKLAVSLAATRPLQANLLRSHACGVGDPAPAEVVRAAMLLRAVSLARGHSGVRPVVVERLIDMLGAGAVPEVPVFGSLGASGDLAPLSHMALPLIGEGFVMYRGRRLSGRRFLRTIGWPALQLEMKEGLALNNGVQFTTAFGVLLLAELTNLLDHATLATAMTAQVMLASAAPFRADLHAQRPHPGARRVAEAIWQLMQDSPIREFHRRYDVDGEVQDPYNLRCAAQVLGACAELLDDAARTFAIEANAVTDNPIILPLAERELPFVNSGSLDPGDIRGRVGQHIDIVSGGHFHGMPIATRLYGLVQAMAIMARLANMRAARYVDEDRNKGLGADLKWPGLSERERATSSAMMIPEYVSASLTNWIWGASMPSHLLSISTDAGQEDFVSMSAGLAVRAWETLPRLAEVLAIELAYAAQAAAIRKVQDTIPSRLVGRRGRAAVPWAPEDRRMSPACEAVVARIAEVFPPVVKDRELSTGLHALARLVHTGELVTIARAACPTAFPTE